MSEAPICNDNGIRITVCDLGKEMNDKPSYKSARFHERHSQQFCRSFLAGHRYLFGPEPGNDSHPRPNTHFEDIWVLDNSINSFRSFRSFYRKFSASSSASITLSNYSPGMGMYCKP